MWECAICRRRLWKNSGQHRVIKTGSGNYRTAGLCPDCAARQDQRQQVRSQWKARLLFAGIALSALVVISVYLLTK